ncbi:LPXTG cell wall anchor domain-containing protein [Oceanobacillus rekensis]|uniref:LPXTG cell wall anchor domain-containing protein n=1 Tax=Oceanobacillus rekensis TaxID=937927 RepID=UPI000B4336C8|nr:LPXTG cell wall anchor domain-containing protein [Oceanobacillus rekensis]
MKHGRVSPFVLLVASILVLVMVNVKTVKAEDKITIDILPEEVLFNVDNMKPGDWAPRTVIVQNNGGLNFDYYVSVEPNGDSKKLYNELIVEIHDADQLLYNGHLKDFSGLPPRSLESTTEEELNFTIRFPVHLGNDYQGLDANFSILFTAEGMEDVGKNDSDEQSVAGAVSSDGNSSSGGSSSSFGGLPLPNTATNIFNFLIIGALLIIGGSLIILYNRKKVSE